MFTGHTYLYGWCWSPNTGRGDKVRYKGYRLHLEYFRNCAIVPQCQCTQPLRSWGELLRLFRPSSLLIGVSTFKMDTKCWIVLLATLWRHCFEQLMQKEQKMTWKITCERAWRWKSITLLWKFLQKSAIFHNLSSFVRTPPSVTSLLASLLILNTSNSHHQMTQGFQETNVKMPSNNNEREGFSLGPSYQMGRVYL